MYWTKYFIVSEICVMKITFNLFDIFKCCVQLIREEITLQLLSQFSNKFVYINKMLIYICISIQNIQNPYWYMRIYIEYSKTLYNNI